MQVIVQTEAHRYRVLIFACLHLRKWQVRVRKMKMIYNSLNLFGTAASGPGGASGSEKTGQKGLIGEGWCPTKELGNIQFALQRGTVRFAFTLCFHYADKS